MDQMEFDVYYNQKGLRLVPDSITFYRQAQIIEAYSENNEVYYLFFYHYQFLTAAKATRIRRGSFLAKAFQKGMIFKTPHPFLSKIISSNTPLHINTYDKLRKKLNARYSPQEIAFILTFFESFIPKKQLFSEIVDCFYEYRRNGQMGLAYRIIHILEEFAPKHSLVKTLQSDMVFDKYAELYRLKDERIMLDDVIFAERFNLLNKHEEPYFNDLIHQLEKEERFLDVIALYTQKLSMNPSADTYSSFIYYLYTHLSETEIEYILEEVAIELPSFTPLHQDLFLCYLSSKHLTKAHAILKKFNFDIPNSSILSIATYLEREEDKGNTMTPEILSVFLQPICTQLPERAEKLLTTYTAHFLKVYDVKTVHEWLHPFKSKLEHLALFEKMDKMNQISNDLDQMDTLGELYFEFNLLEKAIECYSWEMEMRPNDPKPLLSLAKIYTKLGMEDESKAYQDLSKSLKKWA